LLVEIENRSRDVILEDYRTYIHRVMLVRFGTRVRVSHNSRSEAWIVLENVMYSKECMNIISVSSLDKNHIRSTFGNNKCTIFHTKRNEYLGSGTRRLDGLYQISGYAKKVKISQFRTITKDTLSKKESGIDLWHKRLGHTNHRSIKEMANKSVIEGIYLNERPDQVSCDPCAKGKQPKESHKEHLVPHGAKLGIFSDVCGPFQTKTLGGAQYMVTFTDGASRHTTTKLMKQKSEVTGEWKMFKAQFENQNYVKIKTLHTDNGGEYVNNELARMLKEAGIEHVKTVPFNPKSNGIAVGSCAAEAGEQNLLRWMMP
jgi:GAG-pre-integrase domain/Integrase core domain